MFLSMTWEHVPPEKAAKWEQEGEPAFKTTMAMVARHKDQKARAKVLGLLTLAIAGTHFLPTEPWIVAVGTSFVLCVGCAVDAFRTYFKADYLVRSAERNFKIVEPKPRKRQMAEHRADAVVTYSHTKKKKVKSKADTSSADSVNVAGQEELKT